MTPNLAAVALWLAASGAAAGADGIPAAGRLQLVVGGSAVIDYPADIGRIATSSPEVADAVAVSSREVLLHGKAWGQASVVIWAKSGGRTYYTVTVEHNLDAMRRLLQDTFPGEEIRLQGARDSVALTGHVSSPAVAERAAALVAPLAKSVVNNLEAPAPGPEKQILLRVKFAELNRTAASAFGLNLVSTGALNTPGRVTTGQFQAPSSNRLTGALPGRIEGTTSEFTISDALNVFAFRPDLNLAAFLKALQSQGLLQILAEPNLVTMNNKEASFLVGGEFPIPIVQGGANAGAITIQFREFGIRLSFLPVVTPYGTIRMHVKPEVSTIDITNALSVSGFTIPALATRRVETHIELGRGQSFAIAGLIDDRASENLAKIPGLVHIPILGALFKSRQENKTKTELLVLVTPELTAPLDAAEAKSLLPPMPRPFLPPAAGPQRK